MSASKKNPKSPNSIPASYFRYCPDYLEFMERARKEFKIRFIEHTTERKKQIVQCIDSPIQEINNLPLDFNSAVANFRMINSSIEQTAIRVNDKEIQKWGGVQIATCKKFKKLFAENNIPMDYKTFSSIATNNQDQTSWKVTGNYFFAPYIKLAGKFLREYCDCIMNINDSLRREIYEFGCICYVIEILEKKIKFHRTKLKPLIRHKTLVQSKFIHYELEQLCSELKVARFIEVAKKRRKQTHKKNHIISKDFHANLLSCSKNIYETKKSQLYSRLKLEYNSYDLNHLSPSDLLGSDDDDSQNTTAYSTSISPNYGSTLSGTPPNSNRREFQAVPPFGIRPQSNRQQRRNDAIQHLFNGINQNVNDDDYVFDEEQKIQSLEQENIELRNQLQYVKHLVRETAQNTGNSYIDNGEIVPARLIPPQQQQYVQEQGVMHICDAPNVTFDDFNDSLIGLALPTVIQQTNSNNSIPLFNVNGFDTSTLNGDLIFPPNQLSLSFANSQ